MADPLTAVADRFVPPETNFFDPAEGQSVIARYGNSRIGLEASDRMAQSAGRLFDIQQAKQRQKIDEEQMARDRLTWTREDEDYAAKKELEGSRVELLRAFNAIDATAPDYTQKVSEFVTSIPAGLVQDEALRLAIQAKNADADDARRSREAEVAHTRRVEMDQIRAARNPTFMFLKPEDYAEAMLPDGTRDEAFLGMRAKEREMAAKGQEWDRRRQATEEGRVRLMKMADLSARARRQRPEFEKFMVEDTKAFPSQVDMFLKGSGKKTLEDAKSKDEAGYRRAVEWDKNKIDNELVTAWRYDNPEDYINLAEDKDPAAPRLTAKQREMRRRLWQHAQESVEEDETGGGTTAPAAGGGEVKDAKGKPLSTEQLDKFLDEAGGDPAKAKELARKAGFSF